MRRSAKVVIGVVAVPLVLLAACAVLLATVDWNHARPWVGRQLGELASRPVSIQGDLKVQWMRPPSSEDGWRRWAPWPRISADRIAVGNPPWLAQDTGMATVGHVSVVINPLALLRRTVQIAELDLESANVSLLRGEDGENNWSLKSKSDSQRDSKPSGWTFDLQNIALKQVIVRVQDPASQLDAQTELNSLDDETAEGYGLGWKTTGSYNQVDVAGEGRMGRILSLQEGSQPFPLSGTMTIGKTVIALAGSVTRPQALASLDVRLRLTGHSMADLYPLTGVALPNTPPYSTEGRLIGTLEGAEPRWTYEDFKGKVGSSDLQGTLHFLVRKPRSLLTGELESKLLTFKDLGPLIGVDSDEEPQSGKKSDSPGKDKDAVRQPADKALPVQPIDTEPWGAMDADVKFSGLKILRNKNLPLDNVRAHVRLDDSVLKLDPLNFGVAGGNLVSKIDLDGKGDTIKGTMTISARHLKLKKLFPAAESMDASFGELHGDAALSAEGDSIGALLGHSNGEIQALVSKGTISHFLLETAGLNVANMVIVKLFGDDQVILNCLASDFSVKDGVMNVRAFKLDTEDAVVDVLGQVNLRTERFDLDIKPANKSVRIFTLRTPLYVKGSFKNPDVGVYKGPLIARAGAAVALGVVATPLAALLPLLNTGTADADECGPLLAQVSDKPKAPKPGDAEKAAPAKEKKAK